jgi:hypothetical protein
MIDNLLRGLGVLFRSTSHRPLFFLIRGRWSTINWLFCILAACNSAPAEHQAVKVPPGVIEVHISKTPHGYRLMRGGKPYFIKGGAGLEHFERIKEAGGNSVRIWTTDYAEPLMQEAQKQGLTVMLGVWLEPETKYFTYYDPAQVKAQLSRVREQVLRFRRSPALLCWNLANEMEFTAPNPRFYAALNDVAVMIHELDPYHPVTVSQVDFAHNIDKIQRMSPAIDVISINIYGALGSLPARLQATTWRGPYIVSEYGGAGYWERDATTWGAPYEQSSSEKAHLVRRTYKQTIIGDSTSCLGGYVFFWGYKFEYTGTWFSLFEPKGEKTAVIDELQLLWKGQYPANRAPDLTSLLLAGHKDSDNIRLAPGQLYPATVTVTDPEGDTLNCRWEVLPDMRMKFNSREIITPPEPVPGSVAQVSGTRAVLRTPTRPGPYRLFVRVFDGHGSVATSNIPFLVRAGATQALNGAATAGKAAANLPN